MIAIEDIETAIAVAKPEELVRINAALRARKQIMAIPEPGRTRKGPQAVATAVTVDDMLGAIVLVARRRGLEFASLQQLQKSHGYGAFKTKVQMLQKYLKPEGWSRTESRAFMVLAVDLLFKNLQDMNVAVSARTAMSHIHRLPAVVDTAFPGYHRCGMLKWVLKIGDKDVRKK